MYNLNPLKVICNMEDENIEFKELGVLGGIGVAIIYILLATIFILINLVSIRSISMSYIYKTLNVLIYFSLILVFYASRFYKIDLNSKKENCQYPNSVNIRNIFLVTLFIIGFKLIFDSSLMPFIEKFQSLNTIENDVGTVAKNLIIYAFVVGPLVEEVFFRGIILNGLAKVYSIKMAAIVSSLIFGIMHFNIYQFFMAFLLGLMLSYLYIKTHSIILCIWAHIIHNTYTHGTLILFPSYFSFITSDVLVQILIAILGLAIMLVTFKKFTHEMNKL